MTGNTRGVKIDADNKIIITIQQNTQGIRRLFLPPAILVLIFILTNIVFATVAAGRESLSVKAGAYANHPEIFMDANGRVSGFCKPRRILSTITASSSSRPLTSD